MTTEMGSLDTRNRNCVRINCHPTGGVQKDGGIVQRHTLHVLYKADFCERDNSSCNIPFPLPVTDRHTDSVENVTLLFVEKGLPG